MRQKSTRTSSRHRTDDELLKELEDLGRRVHETAETVRDGRHKGPVSSLLGRQFPLPGLDDARRLLLDQMRDGACILSSDGNVIVCNRAFAHLLGRPIEKIIGAPLTPFLLLGDRPLLRTVLNSSSRLSNAEASFVRPDHSERRVALVAQRTLLYGFKACCLVTRDLTEEKSMSEIVRSDELSRIVFEQAGEAIVVCDADGKILRANRKASDLALESPDQKLIGEAFTLLTPTSENPDEPVPVNVVSWLKAGGETPLEARLPWRDDTSIHVMLNAGRIHNASGDFLGWVVTFTNISSHVDSERELRRASQREKELNDSLKRQAEELREKNLELEQFALTASHDLQEPLRKINSFGDLLTDANPAMDERSRDYLARMKRSANRMTLLIEDLLQYARASGEKEAPKEVDLAAVAKDVLNTLDVVIEKSGAKVEFGPMPVVVAARGQMHQLFVNLVGNAIKYRGPSDPWVKVRAERQGDRWQLTVQDNGIGIEERYTERIFKIFERLHSRNQYLGTGIGLAICRKIVERHGGNIWVVSEPGKGSSFTFTLPDPPAAA